MSVHGPADEEPLDFTLWRARLIAAPAVPDVHDQIAWTDLLQAVGLGEPAVQLLRKTAAMRRGFSWQLRGDRRPEPPQSAAGMAGPGAHGLTIDIAIAELTAFAKSVARLLPATLCNRNAGEAPIGSPHAPLPQSAAPAAVSADFAQMIDRLHEILQGPAAPADWGDAQHLLATLDAALSRQPDLDYRCLAGAPVSALAYAIAFASLREFVRCNRDLMAGPFGSAELLYRAARFDSAGLGPYFCNISQLARRSRDVFELASIARSAGQEAGVSIDLDVWVALLSRTLGGALGYEVADDLGDLGMTGVLASFCRHMAGLPDERIDVAMLGRIRDSGIDNADWDLAARSQEIFVRLAPEDVHERLILGTIHATAGNAAVAEQLFRECLAMLPGFVDAEQRLFALRIGRFGRFALRHGFETPVDRRLARMHRGDVSPVRPGLIGDRIQAVEA